MKKVLKLYYWIQMRFARRAWISTNRSEAMWDYHRYCRLLHNMKRAK